MTRRGVVVRLVVLSMGVALAVGVFGQASAQYPPATGSVVLGAGDTTPVLGDEVTVTATVLDENGDPQAGVACTFSIAQQPGSDASVDPGPFTSSASGDVSTTLNVGSTAGTVAVEATCGELSASVSVLASAGEAPALPPASLPDTGAGADGDASGWAFWILVAAGASAGMGGLAIAWRRARARA